LQATSKSRNSRNSFDFSGRTHDSARRWYSKQGIILGKSRWPGNPKAASSASKGLPAFGQFNPHEVLAREKSFIGFRCGFGALVSWLHAGASSKRSFVRIVNAAPDAGTIDVTINGNKILTAMAYGTGSNYFTEGPGTDISLKIVSAGGVNGSTSATIEPKNWLHDKVYYTIAVVGLTVAPSTFTILQTEE